MAERPIFVGFRACREVAEFGIMFRWLNQRSESGGCGMRMPSPGFVRNPRCAASSAIRRRGSSPLNGAQKNDSAAAVVERSRVGTTGGLRQVRDLSCGDTAYLPRVRGAARAVPRLRQGEARAAGVPGRQPVLHQALCAITWAGAAARPRSRTWPRSCISTGTRSRTLEKQYMRAQLAKAGTPGPKVDRHRRDLDPQRPHLSDRGQRPAAPTPDLVRRRGPLRAEHDQFYE